MLFEDRRDAGRALAKKLSAYANDPDSIVLALPRGGVPVAYEVAKALNLPLDIFIVRKLGVPGHEEMAMGAIASGGTRVLNREVVSQIGISREHIEVVADRELRELERRERAYRDGSPSPQIKGRRVILVDDGLATGASMRAAVQALRQLAPEEIVVAVPVAAPQTCDEFRDIVESIICAVTPEPFYAVGLWYRDFSQTTDEEVQALLADARALHPSHEGSTEEG